jgi:hypothetical protein
MTDGITTYRTRPFCIFEAAGLRGLKFECRPISDTPPDKTVSIMYRRNGDGLRQCGVGLFKDRAWTDGAGKPLDEEGLFWTRLVPHDD